MLLLPQLMPVPVTFLGIKKAEFLKDRIKVKLTVLFSKGNSYLSMQSFLFSFFEYIIDGKSTNAAALKLFFFSKSTFTSNSL